MEKEGPFKREQGERDDKDNEGWGVWGVGGDGAHIEWSVTRFRGKGEPTCRMMSTHERMEGSLEVKGAAIDASPSFTIGSSPVSPSNKSSPAAEAAAIPYFLLRACCSLTSSCFIRLLTAIDAPK